MDWDIGLGCLYYSENVQTKPTLGKEILRVHSDCMSSNDQRDISSCERTLIVSFFLSFSLHHLPLRIVYPLTHTQSLSISPTLSLTLSLSHSLSLSISLYLSLSLSLYHSLSITLSLSLSLYLSLSISLSLSLSLYLSRSLALALYLSPLSTPISLHFSHYLPQWVLKAGSHSPRTMESRDKRSVKNSARPSM